MEWIRAECILMSSKQATNSDELASSSVGVKTEYSCNAVVLT
jgi:hypothetical protein